MIASRAVWRRWLLGAVVWPLAVCAQRVDENAVTAADDAFGTTVGSQTIGLYSAEDVRGFSPRDAGNLRIEGLYFDQQTYFADACLVPEQTIRVGLAAQSFDFPAPTGIANYSLRVPGSTSLTSVVVSRGPFDAAALELDGQYGRAGQPVSVSLCFHRTLNSDFDFARRAQSNDTGVIVRGQMSDELEVIVFGGTTSGNEHYNLPFVFTSGNAGVPTFRQMRLPTQDWTHWTWEDLTAGAIVRSTGAGPWSVAAGVFRSVVDDPANYDDLFLDVDPNGIGTHQINLLPPLYAASTSGEVRLSRLEATGTRTQQWSITVRGRDVSRSFGGESSTNFGQASIYDYTPVAQPPVQFTPGSEDRVRQYGVGVSFDERWPGRGSLGVGVQKVSYRRAIDARGVTTAHDESNPLLPTFRFTVNPDRKVLLYGSYARGLEDSALAPSNALNNGESPPATVTWQWDTGVRYMPRPSTQLLVGAFEVHKGYFNLDTHDIYRQLGQIRHRGLEASATINTGPGLVAVLGGVWLQGKLLNTDDAAASQGNTPLGTTPLVLNADLDYAPPSWKPWALGCGWQGTSSRPATTDGSVKLPAYSLLSLTVRYTFHLFGHPGVARFDADDLGNGNAMLVDASGTVASEHGRSFAFTLAVDF